MTKFKVGDKVRRIGGDHEGMKIGDVAVVSYSNNSGVVLRGFGTSFHDIDNLELATPSAIRTVTKREIVLGKYGNVVIDEVGRNYVSVNVRDIFHADDLREAAALFVGLADVLDESAK